MADANPLFDGQTDFSGGMDMSRSPELISPNQISLGVNVTTRNGYPSTRPPFNRLLLDFAGDNESEDWWNTHYFQGAKEFNVNGGYPSLVTSVGGRIYNLQPQELNFEVTDITPKNSDGSLDRNSSILTKAYFCQADVYLVIQDGQSNAFIFDGSTVRRRNPNIPEVPVGTIMAYGQGRLAVAFANQFVIGDINGGATNVLSFTETQYLNGGGSFILPMNMGNVTGMIFTAQQDTNTGQGQLLVFGESGCISVNLNVPREQWQNTQIISVTLTDIGTLADRSLVTINADIFFRSQDGIRTYRDARAEFGQYSLGNYGRTALSYEIGDYLAADTLGYQQYTSGIVFDNRYLVTTQPVNINGIGVPIFQALAVMDFIPVSALRYNQPPVFDGLWTGLQFYQLVEGQFATGLRAFGFVRGEDNAGDQQLQLWEITTDLGDDNGECPIQCAFESKAFTFGSPITYKKVQYLRYWADQLQGRVDWLLRLKPDQYPGWFDWQTWTDEAPIQTCTDIECSSLPNLQPQYRPGRNLVLAPEACMTNGQVMARARDGCSFQIRFEWAGVARVTKLLFTAMSLPFPKLDCLTIDPPADPIKDIIAIGKTNGSIPPANQYLNEEIIYTCPAGTTGSPVTIPAGTYSSTISVADANAQALAAAIAMAVCMAPGNFSVVASAPDYSGGSGPSSFLTFTLDGGSPFLSVPGVTYQYNTSLKIDASLSLPDQPSPVQQGFTTTNLADQTINTASASGTLNSSNPLAAHLVILFSDFNTGDILTVDQVGAPPVSGSQTLGSPLFIPANDFIEGNFNASNASSGTLVLIGTIEFSL